MIENKRKETTRRAWKRVAKRERAFGWLVNDATEYEITSTSVGVEVEETYSGYRVSPKTTTSTSRYVILDLFRDSSDFLNLGAIKVFEVLYNIASTIRMILGKIFRFGIIPLIIFLMVFAGVKGTEGNDFIMKVGIGFYACVGVYFAMLMIEQGMMEASRGVLKTPDGQLFAAAIGDNYGENMTVAKRVFLSISNCITPFLGMIVGLILGMAIWQNNAYTCDPKIVILTLFGIIAISLAITVITLIKLWQKKQIYSLFALINFLAPLVMLMFHTAFGYAN